MTEQSLLLIGGTGFFGKSFLDAYARGLLAPWRIGRVVVLARDTSALRRGFPALMGPTVELVDADITRAERVPAADYVIHAAASTDARRYVAAPEQERANILAGIGHYRQLARQFHRDSRILYTSSGAVYGAQPADLPALDESMGLMAAGGLVAYKRAYAEAKRAAEGAMAGLGGAGLRVAVARCFAFLGVHLPRDQHFAIGNFLEDGLRGRPVRLNARHPVVRSYMHADDLVCWLMTIVAAADRSCPVYNVGSPEPVLLADLARDIAARFGVEAEVPDLEGGSADRYVPSVHKACRELGLTLRYNLCAALDEIVGLLHTARPRSRPN